MPLLYRLLSAGCLVAAAACGPATMLGPPKLLTVLPTESYDVFPVLRPASGDTSLCAAASTADSTIPYQRVTAGSRYLGALSLRLPSVYTAEPTLPLHGSEDFGGIRVASWMVASDIARNRVQSGKRLPIRSVTVWIDPASALPSVGAPPGTKQLDVVECVPARAARRTRVALFRLAMATDTTAYLAAVWPSPGGRYLQLIASAATFAELLPVQRALLDPRSEPASRGHDN